MAVSVRAQTAALAAARAGVGILASGIETGS